MQQDQEFGPSADVLGLNYGEHLIVWALRRIVVRRGVCPLIIREFTDACGEDGSEVLAIFRVFVETLGQAVRRPLSVGYPGWCGLTGDERQLLSLIAADDQPRLDALLSWLARVEAQHRFAVAVRALAIAFATHHLRISSAAPTVAAISAERTDLRLVS